MIKRLLLAAMFAVTMFTAPTMAQDKGCVSLEKAVETQLAQDKTTNDPTEINSFSGPDAVAIRNHLSTKYGIDPIPFDAVLLFDKETREHAYMILFNEGCMKSAGAIFKHEYMELIDLVKKGI